MLGWQQGACLIRELSFFRVEVLKRCGSYMQVFTVCSTEEDNAAQLRMFSSGKSYQYDQVRLSIWLRIFSTDLSHFSAQSMVCSMYLSQI